MDDWGVEMSETVRITESGEPEVFSDLPRQVFVKA
jgi:ectoine hydrolase